MIARYSDETITGADTYTVKRATTNDGPFTSVATPTGTSHSDTGLANSTTYFHVVTAINSAGESTASAPVSATTHTALETWSPTHFGTTANSGNTAHRADPDGDGWINSQEYAAGTDPAGVLRAGIEIDGGGVAVSFPSISGKTYRVERSDTLQVGSWTTIQDNIASAGGTVQVTDSGGAAQAKRFCRSVLVP